MIPNGVMTNGIKSQSSSDHRAALASKLLPLIEDLRELLKESKLACTTTAIATNTVVKPTTVAAQEQIHVHNAVIKPATSTAPTPPQIPVEKQSTSDFINNIATTVATSTGEIGQARRLGSDSINAASTNKALLRPTAAPLPAWRPDPPVSNLRRSDPAGSIDGHGFHGALRQGLAVDGCHIAPPQRRDAAAPRHHCRPLRTVLRRPRRLEAAHQRRARPRLAISVPHRHRRRLHVHLPPLLQQGAATEKHHHRHRHRHLAARNGGAAPPHLQAFQPRFFHLPQARRRPVLLRLREDGHHPQRHLQTHRPPRPRLRRLHRRQPEPIRRLQGLPVAQPEAQLAVQFCVDVTSHRQQWLCINGQGTRHAQREDEGGHPCVKLLRWEGMSARSKGVYTMLPSPNAIPKPTMNMRIEVQAVPAAPPGHPQGVRRIANNLESIQLPLSISSFCNSLTFVKLLLEEAIPNCSNVSCTKLAITNLFSSILAVDLSGVHMMFDEMAEWECALWNMVMDNHIKEADISVTEVMAPLMLTSVCESNSMTIACFLSMCSIKADLLFWVQFHPLVVKCGSGPENQAADDLFAVSDKCHSSPRGINPCAHASCMLQYLSRNSTIMTFVHSSQVGQQVFVDYPQNDVTFSSYNINITAGKYVEALITPTNNKAFEGCSEQHVLGMDCIQACSFECFAIEFGLQQFIKSVLEGSEFQCDSLMQWDPGILTISNQIWGSNPVRTRMLHGDLNFQFTCPFLSISVMVLIFPGGQEQHFTSFCDVCGYSKISG